MNFPNSFLSRSYECPKFDFSKAKEFLIFLSFQLMYFAFLISFAYALLVKQPLTRAGGSMATAEFVVYIWTISIIPVEIRQVLRVADTLVVQNFSSSIEIDFSSVFTGS